MDNRQTTIDGIKARITAIEKEIAETPKPKLGINSVEDVDELYQAKLEYGWWLDEMNDDLKSLKEELRHREEQITNEVRLGI